MIRTNIMLVSGDYGLSIILIFIIKEILFFKKVLILYTKEATVKICKGQ